MTKVEKEVRLYLCHKGMGCPDWEKPWNCGDCVVKAFTDRIYKGMRQYLEEKKSKKN